jgi:hypothetical protein
VLPPPPRIDSVGAAGDELVSPTAVDELVVSAAEDRVAEAGDRLVAAETTAVDCVAGAAPDRLAASPAGD